MSAEPRENEEVVDHGQPGIFLFLFSFNEKERRFQDRDNFLIFHRCGDTSPTILFSFSRDRKKKQRPG